MHPFKCLRAKTTAEFSNSAILEIQRIKFVYAGSCSAWEIYDEYLRDAERQRLEDASKPKGGGKRPSTAAPGHAHGGAAAGAAAVQAQAQHSTLQGPAGGDGDKGKGGGGRAGVGAAGAVEDEDAALAAAGPGVERALRILDRMVCQNSFADMAMDFKYWEDVTDSFRCACVCC